MSEQSFELKECPFCGVKVRADRKFCSNCGEELILEQIEGSGCGHIAPHEHHSDRC